MNWPAFPSLEVLICLGFFPYCWKQGINICKTEIRVIHHIDIFIFLSAGIASKIPPLWHTAWRNEQVCRQQTTLKHFHCCSEVINDNVFYSHPALSTDIHFCSCAMETWSTCSTEIIIQKDVFIDKYLPKPYRSLLIKTDTFI